MSEEVYINNLPIEVFEMILNSVNGITLGRCRRVCKYWKDIIDGSEKFWYQKCQIEFKNASRIARKKSGKQCTWYHIYRNLSRWRDIKGVDLETRELCKLNISYRLHTRTLDIDNGILAVRVDKTIVLYDTTTLENMTITLPDRNFLRLANNDNITVLQVKSGIYIQRTVASSDFVTEGFFNADDFLLIEDRVYVHYNKDFYLIDLKLPNLMLNFVAAVEYRIKQMSYNDNMIHLFTDNGYIVSFHLNNPIFKVKYRPIKCPVEWIKQIKHVCAMDHENFVCYSNNLLLIQVDKYKHLYLEFPPITALFFYVDIILIGTTSGKILLYRLSDQPNNYKRHNIEPKFETLARLPEGKVALQIDVCERRTGPLVVAATYNQLYVVEIPFFPHEPQTTESSFTLDKLKMYKRMQRLKERLKHDINQDNHTTNVQN